MPNSPIQVVLHTDNFLTAREAGGGGLNKEFYENNDAGFTTHKAAITQSLKNLSDELEHNEFSGVGFAKVVLKRSGWAKSHRPTHALFKRSIAPIVGAGGVGELFVEVNKPSIEKIIQNVGRAEATLTYKRIKKRNGDEVREPNPSRERSEVGAIEKILPYTASDKRSFSVEQGFRWLSNHRTGGNYIIELFENPPPRSEWDALPPAKVKLFHSFLKGLVEVGGGLVTQRITDTPGSYPMLGLRLEKADDTAEAQFLPAESARKRKAAPFDDRIQRHRQLIAFLDNHPLVKKIHLPPIIKRSPAITRLRPTNVTLSSPVGGNIYPQVAIIDGGLANVLNPWILDRWRFLAPNHRDEEHGTFIGGLVVAGGQLNGTDICPEVDGCQLIDIDILPSENVNFAEYFNSTTEFLDELAMAVQTLKARTDVRIFNFSINVEQAVESDSYHPFSRRLDQIALENDVIFVISAGNANYFRPEWPENPTQALSVLASASDDRLKVPAESVRNLSVGAVNPPHVPPALMHAPASYSCRGPGLRIGMKPDLAHIGGCGTQHASLGHGLFSVAPNGSISDGCGTSYATPLVAKTLSSLDNAIEGDVSRETLMALAIHHAVLPKILNKKELIEVARHLVGFGIPESAASILEGDEHKITLVFANRLKEGKRMQFSFSWPQSLVVNGKCTGAAKLTLVSTPPLDYKYGVEFVRVNMNASLRQEQKKGRFKNRLDPIYLPDNQRTGSAEADLIEFGLKWGPVKAYAKSFLNGVGPSTNWHLDVEYILRDGEVMPGNGVPFTALLTISDPKGEKPVFNDVRQMLQSVGVETSDIRTAARIVTRV
jgi:hypothetical protein